VRFSQGNLQYNAAQNDWRFAEHQYDMIGAANANIASDYDGYIDLFGWGTSGYNGKNPWMTSTTQTDYGDGANDIAGTEYDWGVHNAISNGGNEAGKWRTLTKAEWEYIVRGRADDDILFATGSVDGVNGLILLPDDWALPEGATFTPSTQKNLIFSSDGYYNSNEDNFSHNTYTLDQWNTMEQAGAVFLPAVGYRDGTTVSSSDFAHYWSTTQNGIYAAYYMNVSKLSVAPKNQLSRKYGLGVRLVRDTE